MSGSRARTTRLWRQADARARRRHRAPGAGFEDREQRGLAALSSGFVNRAESAASPGGDRGQAGGEQEHGRRLGNGKHLRMEPLADDLVRPVGGVHDVVVEVLIQVVGELEGRCSS